MLVQGPDPSGRPRYADPPPLIRHWRLVYTSGINEYSSSRLLVSGSPIDNTLCLTADRLGSIRFVCSTALYRTT